MKLRARAPHVLIGCAVLALAAISFASYLLSHRMAASFEEGQFALMGRIVHSALGSAEGRAVAAAELLATNPAVMKAFAARDREGLLALTKDGYAALHEKHGVSQAQFHLAPAVSFLRVHNPPRFGEDLSSYRKMVAEVNAAHAVRKGVEVTTSGVGIFGTVPMNDASGKSTGSFEFAYEFGPLLDEMKRAYGFEAALYIDEKILRATATSLQGDVLNERNRVGSFLKFHATHPELLEKLVAEGDVRLPEPTSYVRVAHGIPYGVLVQPVYDYTKRPIGVIAIASDFSAARSADGAATVWQVLFAILGSVFLAVAILVVLHAGRDAAADAHEATRA